MNCFSAHALAAFYADALAASPPRSELCLPFFIATCALIIAGYALRHALVDVNDNNNTIAKAAIPACLQAASSLDVETRAVWDDVTKLYNDEIATPSPYNLATSTGNWCEAHRLRATGEDAKWGALLEESMRIRHVEIVHRQGVKMRCKTVIAAEVPGDDVSATEATPTNISFDPAPPLWDEQPPRETKKKG